MIKKITFALIGNPNCGKSTLFNTLTGSNVYVGNWPGVTVDKSVGRYKKNKDLDIELIDLPGIYSLTPYTDEEKVSRDYLLHGDVSLIIDVVDGTNLERNLYLTSQLMEMNIPIVIALNMADVLQKEGTRIDIDALSKKLSLPVIEVSALKNKNLDKLMEVAINQFKIKREGYSVLQEDEKLNDVVTEAKEIYTGHNDSLYHSIKALECDEIEKERNPIQYNQVNEINKIDDFLQVEANARYNFISNGIDKIKINNKKKSDTLTLSDKIDRVVTHKIWGIPICLLIIFLMFELTFSTDLFYLNAAGVFKGGLNTPLSWIGSGDGINSIGVILSNMISSLCDIITTFFRDVLLLNAPFFVRSLICDGILTAFFTLIEILPQILFLYMLFTILEDSGYMSRIAFMLDRIFRPLGISGRAIIPMVMGFGCSVTAIMNCRTLSTNKEKNKVIRTIPFFTCSAKTTIVTAICGCLLNTFNIKMASLILYGIYILGAIIAIISIYVMNKTTQKEISPTFLMELPNYHLPQPKALFSHLVDKAKHFVKNAATIIILSSFLIWLFVRVSFNWQYLGKEAILLSDVNPTFAYVKTLKGINEDTINNLITTGRLIENNSLIDASCINSIDSITIKNVKTVEIIQDVQSSILSSLGSFVSILFTPLGFGFKTAYTPHIIGNSWVFPLSIVSGLVAKENVISTLSTLSTTISSSSTLLNTDILTVVNVDEKDSITMLVKSIFDNEKYPLETIASLLSFTMFNITTIPCFATVSTVKGELNKKKTFWLTIVFWLAVSYIIGCLTYLVITHWWTVFIILALLILAFILLHYISNGKIKIKFKKKKIAA